MSELIDLTGSPKSVGGNFYCTDILSQRLGELGFKEVEFKYKASFIEKVFHLFNSDPIIRTYKRIEYKGVGLIFDNISDHIEVHTNDNKIKFIDRWIDDDLIIGKVERIINEEKMNRRSDIINKILDN